MRKKLAELLIRENIVLCCGGFFPQKLKKIKNSNIEIITELFRLEETS